MSHSIVHFEIPAEDVERAKKFYSELFGWKFSTPPGFDDYWLIKTSEEEQALGGGLMKRQDLYEGPLSYVGVESVADYAAKIEKLGGKIVVPKSPVPGMGWFAFFKDTESNLFAVWEDDESAA